MNPFDAIPINVLGFIYCKTKSQIALDIIYLQIKVARNSGISFYDIDIDLFICIIGRCG